MSFCVWVKDCVFIMSSFVNESLGKLFCRVFSVLLTVAIHLVAHIGKTTRRDLGGMRVLGMISGKVGIRFIK